MMFRHWLFLSLVCGAFVCHAQGQELHPVWGNDLLKGRSRAVYRSFSPAMKKALPYRQFQQSMDQIQTQFGSFKTLKMKCDSAGIAVYELYTEKAFFELHTSEDHQGLQGFFIITSSYRQPSYASGQNYYQERYEIPVNDSLFLPGRLIAPRQSLPVPLLILVHGSGPMDMDESIGPNKVFWDLAQGLASEGIATFRYDKRTKVSPVWQNSHSLDLDQETVNDVQKALDQVWASDLIDTNSVWVLGHSLGGYAVPRILQMDQRWKGGIILGGNARPVHELVAEQVEYLSRLDGKVHWQEHRMLNKVRQIDGAASSGDWKQLDQKLQKAKGIFYWPVAFFQNVAHYDPAKLLLEEHRQVLVLQGGRDYQVDTSNLRRWEWVASQNTAVRTRYFEDLNHLFIAGEGKPDPAEYFKPGNISKEVIREIAKVVKE